MELPQKISTVATSDTDRRVARDLRIGQVLLESGKITEGDIDRIVSLQLEKGVRFGEAAKELGLVTEVDIQRAVAKQFDYPVLQPGEMNFSADLITAYQPYTEQVEAIRAIRSQLIMRWFGNGRQALCLTAPSRNTGCSYLAANLAVVFSQLHQKTLLIDADLRTPRLHDIFRVPNKVGLTEILSGRTSQAEIVKVEPFENLSVLTAGNLPPNPQELLSQQKFHDLLAVLAERFDVILIDTPPADENSDSQTVAIKTGGALMVVRDNRTHLKSALRLRDMIMGPGCELVGTVLNNH